MTKIDSASLDPRPPKPGFSIIPDANGPILAPVSTIGDITNKMMETMADRIADRVIEKLDARANSTLQSLPE